jgi:hypothetical protein
VGEVEGVPRRPCVPTCKSDDLEMRRSRERRRRRQGHPAAAEEEER